MGYRGMGDENGDSNGKRWKERGGERHEVLQSPCLGSFSFWLCIFYFLPARFSPFSLIFYKV